MGGMVEVSFVSGVTVIARRRRNVSCCAEGPPTTTTAAASSSVTSSSASSPVVSIDGRGFAVPNVGDIVMVPGKWPGQDGVGLVDGVQLKTDKTSVVVDVVELRNVSGGLYAKPRQLRNQKRRFYDVGDVRRASWKFVEAQDAFLVDDVRDGYPQIKPLDPEKQSEDLKQYEELKARLIREAAYAGVVGSIAVDILGSNALALTYATGAVSGLIYLVLLELSIDRIERRSSALFLIRYLLPIAPFIALSVRFNNGASDLTSLLWSLPKDQVFAAVFGFLSYRLPVFVQSGREVIEGLKGKKIQPRGTLSTILATAQQMSRAQEEGSRTSRGNGARILVFSGCSGVGKTTLISRLLEAHGDRIGFSVSYTTRPQRRGEVDSVDYHFVNAEEFEQAIQENKFLEWAKVYGNYYGTSIDAVNNVVESGRFCLLDLDLQGVERVQSELQTEGVFIWVAPPSVAALEARLRERATDDEDVIRTRVASAVKDLSVAASSGMFDYTIVNDDIDRAYAELEGVLRPVLRIGT